MGSMVYIDLQILAEVNDDNYLVKISKKDLNSLVIFDEELILRSCDEGKPVLLEAYGENAVRTEGDANEGNNLSNLPHLNLSDIFR